MADIATRKAEHLDIVLNRNVGPDRISTGLEAVRFVHQAAPEIDLDAIDLSVTFLGRTLQAPFLISSMTGGPDHAEAINLTLAEAAGQLGVALAVGSQRIAVEGGAAGGFSRELRRRAGPVPILANLGAAQIKGAHGLNLAKAAVEMIDADALIIHLNPLQEAVQRGGDRNWRGILDAIGGVARDLGRPVVVKEVGCGISGPLAAALIARGVAAIDVAGAGGTSWAAVEAERAKSPEDRAIAFAFRDWGIPTARAIVDVRATCPRSVVVASGGLRTGIDVAKAIRLGADLAGFAAAILPAALEGTATLVTKFERLIAELKIAAFCTGSHDLAALRVAELETGLIPATAAERGEVWPAGGRSKGRS